MGALSPEERAKLRAVADMIPDLPELRQAQKVQGGHLCPVPCPARLEADF